MERPSEKIGRPPSRSSNDGAVSRGGKKTTRPAVGPVSAAGGAPPPPQSQPPPPFFHNAPRGSNSGYHGGTARPQAARIVPGAAIQQFAGMVPAVPSRATGMPPIPPPRMDLLNTTTTHPSAWGQPQQLPQYTFMPMHPTPSNFPLAATANFVPIPHLQKGAIVTMPSTTTAGPAPSTAAATSVSRQPRKKRNSTDRGKRRKSLEARKPRRPSTTVSIRDDFPDRIVNPLLELPEFPLQPNPPPPHIPNGAELFRWSELYGCRPDTFPLAYYARLLGFDVPHEAPEQYVELNPQTVPLVQDNVWTNVPKEGSFANVWNRNKEEMDYMDPVYRAITTSYDASHLSPASTAASSTPPRISKECVELAQEHLSEINKEWSFYSAPTQQDQHDLKRFLEKHEQSTDFLPQAFNNPGEFFFVAKQNSTVKGFVHYRFQWYRIAESQHAEKQQPGAYGMTSAAGAVMKKPKVSELVFDIVRVYCPNDCGAPDKENGITESIMEEATATAKESENDGDHAAADKENDTDRNTAAEAADGVNEKTGSDGGKQSDSSAVVDDHGIVGEHCLEGPAAIVLVALALEHARSCNIWYGLSQIPSEHIAWFQDYFRMSALKNENNSQSDRIPMVCDLQKCSYRYGFLLKRERDLGLSNRKEPSNPIASSSVPLRERMLVRLPNVDQAKSCMNNSIGQPPPRPLSKRTKKASLFFSSASEKMRSVTFGVHVSLPAPNSPPLELYSLQDSGKQGHRISTSSYTSDPTWEVLRVFAVKPNIPTEKPEDESEILKELCKKQEELVAIENGFEPKLRCLLAKTIEERRAFEHPDAVKKRETEKKMLKDYEVVLERRREVDRAWQKQLEQDMDAVCDICNDGEVTPNNQILFCENCNVAIHQMCYGVDQVPAGDYYCLACRYFDREKMTEAVARQLERGGQVPKIAASALPICCELCPRKQGAFFQADSSSQEKDSNGEGDTAKWVHVVCAKWQGLGFVNSQDKIIEDVTELRETFRFLQPRPRCMLCQGKRGAFNQCRQEGCNKWLHVSCARSTGLCIVTHGENAIGPVETNPWTLCCPEHSNILPQDVPVGSATIEQLVRTAREFPTEPDPPPRPPKFNKMTGRERKLFLADPKYEGEVLKVLMNEKLQGVRCEVCHQCELDGLNLTRCRCCGVVFCASCTLDADGVEAGKEYTCVACRFIEEKTKSNETFAQPKCHMCLQKGGWLREGFAVPVSRKSHWKNHPKDFEKTLFSKKLWNHAFCTLWQHPLLISDPKTGAVDCSNVIMSNGRGHILGKVRCILCCQTGGVKVKCADQRCRDLSRARGQCHMHVTCARQAGFEVQDKQGDDDDFVFYAKCFLHGGNAYAFRAKLEDLIEIERRRAGKKLKGVDQSMSLAQASRLFNAAVLVMQSLGWAWRWAEWWVRYGDNWEPLLEPGEVEELMTKEQLKIVDSTPESRCTDARRCRLTALGAALRNREFDTNVGDDQVALDRALRAMLNTKSLVGPLEKNEIDFFAEWLGRAYRSKSRLLGYGDDRILVSKGSSCVHIADSSPKYELGSRPLPGKQVLPDGHVFESGISEFDDFLKPIKREGGTTAPEKEIASYVSANTKRSPKKQRKNTSPSRKRKNSKQDQGKDDEARTPKKRGRSSGRPKKTPDRLPPNPESVQKRRGRPPKKSPHKLAKEEEDVAHPDAATEVLPSRARRRIDRRRKSRPSEPIQPTLDPTPKRRGPGRPPKRSPPAPEAVGDVEPAKPEKKRGGPGRPRKHPPPELQVPKEKMTGKKSPLAPEAVGDVEPAKPEKKRGGPGRPRKHPPPELQVPKEKMTGKKSPLAPQAVGDVEPAKPEKKRKRSPGRLRMHPPPELQAPKETITGSGPQKNDDEDTKSLSLLSRPIPKKSRRGSSSDGSQHGSRDEVSTGTVDEEHVL